MIHKRVVLGQGVAQRLAVELNHLPGHVALWRLGDDRVWDLGLRWMGLVIGNQDANQDLVWG